MSDLQMTVDVENIKKMSDFPNRDGTMSAEKVKALFDQAAVDIKRHINEVLAPAIDGAREKAYSAALFTEQTLKKEQQEQARRNIGAAKDTAILHELQLLTEEQKAQARENIGAADASTVVTSVDGKTPIAGNVYLGAVSYLEQQKLSAQDKKTARDNIGAVSADIVVQKNTEASVSSLKINHSPKTSDAIFFEGSVVSDKDDLLVNALNLRGDSIGETDDDSVILRNVHAGEEENDAATVGQVVRNDQAQNLSEEQKAQARANIGAISADEIPERKGKAYEHIATVTVTPGADGSLPQYVAITADSEGKSFALSDFIIRAHAGFASGNQSTLYMDVNNNLVISNSAVGSIGASCRWFNIFCRTEADGCIRAENTASAPTDTWYNAQTPISDSRLIPPMYVHVKPPFTAIRLYTLTGNTKAWVDGSKFELWGVRV